MSDELNISRTRKVKMEKRFNLKNAIKMNITIRAKILCIISWLFKVQTEVSDFEWKARRKKFCEGPGRAFMKGFEKGLKKELKRKKYANSK